MRDPAALHTPVMLDEVCDALMPAVHASPSPVMIDATLGMGGHTAEMLTRDSRVHIVGVDRDTHALDLAQQRLAAWRERVTLIHARFDAVGPELADETHSGVDAVLFDLGVSSLQIDDPERGFSYSRDTQLDMRMDTTQQLTAEEVLATYSERELSRILSEYGEERAARRIARAVVAARREKPVTTSAELSEIVLHAVPAAVRRKASHPAKKTFQALRIEVNTELSALRAAVPAACELLRSGGRVCVLSYHSLEDRIVKRFFSEITTHSAPQGLPTIPPEMQPEFQRVTRGAHTPSEREKTQNPRAASAKMRVVERRGVDT